MEYITSHAHSFRTRKTKKGTVIDVVFRVYDETWNGAQKVLSGFSSKRLATIAYNEYVAKNCAFATKPAEYKKTYTNFGETATTYLAYCKATVAAATYIKRAEYFEYHYLPYFADKQIESITTYDIRLWFDGVLSKTSQRTGKVYSKNTLRAIWSELHTFFTWVSERHNTPDVMRTIKRPSIKGTPKEIVFWEECEYNEFIACVEDMKWKTLFSFLYYTGCRIGETLALTESDYSNGEIYICKSLSKKTLNGERYEIKDTKNYKTRRIPIPNILIAQLDEYIAWKKSQGIKSKFLFFGRDEDYLPHQTILNNFKYYTALSKQKAIRIHDLRHSYVSLLIHHRANLAVIAGLIGDTLKQVTETYGHMYESDKRAIILKL